MPKADTTAFRSGLVAIIGAPNAGKSTLLNTLIGQKISITSKKPQTTRNRIVGIVDRPAAQLVFIDTPGVHRAQKALNARIVEVALAAVADVDLVLMLVDAAGAPADADLFLLRKLQAQAAKTVLGLNKIDLIPKTELLRRIDEWSQRYAIVPISARHGTQVEALVEAMTRALPAGPPLYPPDSLTDRSERFIAAEMIREKVFRLTGEEVPYAVAVTVDTFKVEKQGQLARIQATIHVERDSQKGIVIGKGGAKLKQIGEAARAEIERMVGCQVFLKLFVRVQKNWTTDTKALQRFGY